MSEDIRKETFYANLRHKVKMLFPHTKTYLMHAPRFERYGLCLSIWNLQLDLEKYVIKCQKKYYNKTTLTDLDVVHEALRDQWELFYSLGYFHYKNQKKQLSDADAVRRFAHVNIVLNEIGAMIGGLLKEAREKEKVFKK